MFKTNLINLVLVLLLLTPNLLFSGKYEFGKVSKAELEMTTYAPDPDARAVILFDRGRALATRFRVIHKRHLRIKILSKEGYRFTNIKIPFIYGRDKSNIENINAYTFNLENGKVIEEKLTENDIIYEETTDFIDYAYFPLPKVKVGSVIDVEVEYSSSTIGDWYFQHDIPVVHSEFRAAIDEEYFKYNRTVTGYEKVFPKPVKNTFETYRDYLGEKITINTNVYAFFADTLPAFIEEPYMTSKDNFITKVSFELRRGYVPKGGLLVANESWATVSKILLTHPHFGRQIVKNHLRKEAKEILAKTPNIRERVQLAREKINSLIKYNGKDRLIPEHENLRISIREKSGNVADINLNLIALLRKMDYEAHPVVLSTRQNGFIHPAHASIESLNYVLAMVLVGDKKILVDATDPFLPLGHIPFRCLNGSGILLDKETPQRLELLTQENYSKRTSMIIDFTEDTVSGNMKTFLSGYFASEEWKELQGKGKEVYVKEKGADRTDWDITNFSSKWEKESLIQRCKLKRANPFTNKPEVVYLSSMYGDYIDENPFKLESRNYPVDFGCPHNYSYRVILKLPEGYTLEGVPENAKVILPDKGGSFIYTISAMDNQLVISSEFMINKILYPHLEYFMIKQLFQHVVDKYNEKIVLKKI